MRIVERGTWPLRRKSSCTGNVATTVAMASRRNLRQNHQPPLKHEQSTSFAVREAGDGAQAMAGTPSPRSLDAKDSSNSELRSKLADVRREVKEIKDNFTDLEAIRSTLSVVQDTVKSELKKMREETEELNKRIMIKIERIHDYLNGESETGMERHRPSKFVWPVKGFSKLKDQMLKCKAKSFFSDNFYVGINGYKMYLGAHFAEKNNKGKISLSIYMYITKGPNDRTLQWPYRRRSTFVVVDQKNNLHHKMAEIVPEELGRKQEHCFQKPTNGPNKGIGFTALMPLDELEDPEKGYLMNDSFLVHFITCDM